MRKIIITGGPCTGKTTLLDSIAEEGYLKIEECAREIIDLKFNDILTGNFEIPQTDELKEKVSGKVPYEFDSSDFMNNGPIDLSGLDGDMLNDALNKIEAIYKKFHQAQTMQVARAVIKACNSLIENVKNEISEIKTKYLS